MIFDQIACINCSLIYLHIFFKHIFTGQYRAVRDISVAPLTDRDVRLIESLMDDEDESALNAYRAERVQALKEQKQKLIEFKKQQEEKEAMELDGEGAQPEDQVDGGILSRLLRRRRPARPPLGGTETIVLSELAPEVERELLAELGIDEALLRSQPQASALPSGGTATGGEAGRADLFERADLDGRERLLAASGGSEAANRMVA